MHGNGSVGDILSCIEAARRKCGAVRLISQSGFLRTLAALLIGATVNGAAPEAIKGYVVVPMEARNNQFHVHVQINGKPAELLLDTGMPYTVLLASRAQKFGTLRPAGSRGLSSITSLVVGPAE